MTGEKPIKSEPNKKPAPKSGFSISQQSQKPYFGVTAAV
jgi:hypothetical protein